MALTWCLNRQSHQNFRDKLKQGLDPKISLWELGKTSLLFILEAHSEGQGVWLYVPKQRDRELMGGRQWRAGNSSWARDKSREVP